MTGRLLKHELEATRSYYMPFLVAIMAMAVANTLAGSMRWLEDPDVERWLALLTVGLIMLLALSGLAVTTRRFYLGLPANQTGRVVILPDSAHYIIRPQLYAALIWNMSGAIVSLMALLALAETGSVAGRAAAAVTALGQRWFPFQADMVLPWGGQLLSYVLLALGIGVCLVNIFLLIYLCLCLGQRFNKLRGPVILLALVVLSGLQFRVSVIPILLTLLLAAALYYALVARMVGKELSKVMFPLQDDDW